MIPRLQWQTWTGSAWVTDTDLTAALLRTSTTHGRADAFTLPNATTATITLAADLAPVSPIPGDRFRLTLDDDLRDLLGLTATQAARFTGEVTDAISSPSNTTKRGAHTITATGRLARARRRPITPDAVTWLPEDDAARVTRVLAQVLTAGDLAVVDPGTALLATPEAQATTAGALLDDAATSSGAVLIEYPDGRLEWHGYGHRRGSAPLVVIPAAQLENGFTWSRRIGDVINSATVTRPTVDDGAQATLRLVDAPSIAARDEYPTTITTSLLDHGDAARLAIKTIGRRGRPFYQLPNLRLDVLRSTTDDAQRGLLAALQFGDRLTLTGLPPSPDAEAITELDCFVEQVTDDLYRSPGTADVATRNQWRRTIVVSPLTLSAVSPRFADLPTGLRWSDVKTGLTYLDSVRVEDPADLIA